MRYFLFALFTSVMFASTASATDCKRHPIFCKIKKLQPRINNARAMEISNYVYRLANVNGIDPMISLAILNQENRFRDVHTYEIERTKKEICHATSCIKEITEHHEVIDIGIAQINVRTAVSYGFDLQKLYDHDLEYAISCHMKILKDKIRMCENLGDDAWSCYHSKTPIHRLKYVELVSRYR